ncbi:MAG: phage holin family protein [Betaproteobacteria bacterium]
MIDIPGGESGGLFAALKNVSTILLASGKTRLELLANELEEQKLRAAQLLLAILALAFCLCAGTLIAVLFLTALFWDDRLVVLGAAGILFLGLGGVFFGLLKRLLHPPEKMFAASIAELQEDLRQLKATLGRDE